MSISPRHILVVIADAGLARTVQDYLATHRIRVSLAPDSGSARVLLDMQRVDLVVLDLSSQHQADLLWARDLGDAHRPPFLAIVDPSDATQPVVALELGADDCLTKPPRLRELLARIRAVWGRSNGNRRGLAVGSRIARFDQQQVDLTAQTVTDPEGNVTRLTTGEMTVLRALLENPGVVLSRAQLSSLLGADDDMRRHGRAVDVLISRLRSKLGPRASCIRSVRGKGYDFLSEVTWAIAGAEVRCEPALKGHEATTDLIAQHSSRD